MIKRKNIGALLSCAAICSTLLCSYVPVYAADNNVTAAVEDSQEKDSDIIADSEIKSFSDTSKLSKYLDFDYKLPDYIPDKAYISRISAERFAESKNNDLSISFDIDTSDDLSDTYSIYAFKNDLMTEIKNLILSRSGDDEFPDENIKKESKTINGIKGFDISVYVNEENTDFVNYFAWQEDDIWYVIQYSYFNTKLDYDEVGKIAASLKSPSEIKNVKYKIDDFIYVDDDGSFRIGIYDTEDLQTALGMLEDFTPKVPLTLKNGMKLTDCSAYKNMFNSTDYYYGFDESYTSGYNYLLVKQSTDSSEYNLIKESGSTYDGDSKKVDVSKIDLNDITLLKYQYNKYWTTYCWKEGNIYYTASVNLDDDSKSLGDSDDIIKDFLSQN